MNRFFVSIFAAVLLIASGVAHALTFDNAYTVGSVGSTVQVTAFDINGPAPVLFLDLPTTGSFLTFVSSNWFHDPDITQQFLLQQSSFVVGTTDKFWMSPSVADWSNKGALGDWHVNVNFDLVGLLCAESGGICAPRSEGSGNAVVSFTVLAFAVPEPTPVTLLGIGVLAVLGLSRLRRNPV